MTTTAGEQIRPFHEEAAKVYTILPPACIIDEDAEPGALFGQTHMNGLLLGVPRYQAQQGFTVTRHRGLHEAGHAFFARLYYWIPVPIVGVDWHERAWKFLGYANSYDQQLADAKAPGISLSQQWNTLPEERLAEAFASSIDGVQLQGVPSPAALREFFLAMQYEAQPSTRPPLIDPPKPEVHKVKSALRVIAGHGGKDTGAIAGDLIERDVNIQAVLSFNDWVGREYVPHDLTIVVMGPNDPRDGNATLLAKIADANAAGSDQVLLEIHHNVGAAGTGAQLWYSQNARTTPMDETWNVLPHLARELGFLLGEPIPQLSSDHSRFGKLGILDDTTCTAILIELRNLNSVPGADWEYGAGAAIGKAMAAYFGWPRNAPPLPPPPPAPVDAKLDQAKELARKIVAL